ncbi:unnamed protein product [Prorocentrum cordatum]|uniref:Sulfotransferase domain-containing protein n=1 Tax=Prorocentrum cordatum TaxID=2364126 RepID=A0ABN9W284_9DINO|nr:unnamed protein product [Polarella glacialis]
MWPFGRKTAAKSLGHKNVTIILNGEPKSGTTWLEYVAKDLLTQACESERPGCELLQGVGGRTVSALRTSGLVRYDIDAKHRIPNIGHKNEFDFSMAPSLSDAEVEAAAKATLTGETADAKWLAIFRDPRDVTISSCYHMSKGCPDATGYVQKATKRHRIDRIAKWIALRHRFFDALQRLAPERVMILFYEEMKKDEEGTIKKLANYFEVPLTRKQRMLISSHTTFSAMKDMGSVKVAQGGAASGKVREGASCGYAKELSADGAQRVTAIMRRDLSPALNAVWKC